MATVTSGTAAANPTVGASRLLTEPSTAFLETCRADVGRAQDAISKLKNLPATADPQEAVASYDAANELLLNASSRASLARNVHPDAELRDVAERCEHEVEAAATALSLDRGVYDVLARLELAGLDAPTAHYVERLLRDFRRAGVDRDVETRARIQALREELVKLGQEFNRNIRDDVRTVRLEPADLEGLPEDYRRAHAPGPDATVAITTDNTDYVPFMAYARSSEAREALWRAYRLRGHPKNLDVLDRMLARRFELARLLGYDNWADYITGDKMIATRANAAQFIERIASAADARLKQDYAQVLGRLRRDRPEATEVAAWDSSYLQELVKTEQYDFDSQAVRPYFEYERVKRGVMDVTGQLFGITYREVTDAAVWHPDVDVYDVVEGDRVLGRIYLDMHPRENKYKHYAQFTLVNGRADTALPEGVLVCNFPRPGAEPALMQHSDVETFFHEFGHLLHHVFGGHTRWAGISGVATEWDFVEAPSQLLEEWVWNVETLQRFARHHETGEPIPAELVNRMREADEFGKGLYVRQQMFYAATSLELHSRDPKGLDTTKVVAELQERYTPFRHVDGTYFQESFSHLDGYSAIYYTYMWSLVIAKDLFAVFEEEGLLDAGTAARYRRAILEPGGSKPATQLIRDFLGREHEFAAYEAWLNAR